MNQPNRPQRHTMPAGVGPPPRPDSPGRVPADDPEAEAAVNGRATVSDGLDRLGLRRWFYPYVALLAGLLVAQWRGLIPLRHSWLTLYFVYMALACTFMPLPTAAPVMFVAKMYHPLLVAALGTLGTGLANLQDYHMLTYLLRRKRIAGVRRKGWYVKAEAWFQRAPFATLTAASFLPIPVDVVRLLAIGSRYPRMKFALASVVGRGPRYALLAYLGAQPFVSLQTILLVLIATIILGLSRGLPRLIRQGRAT